MKYVIEVKNISKSFKNSEGKYEKKAVDNLSISIEKGKIYGFLGPNGSGKTTTMRIISGLLSPDSGEGTCLGLNILKDGEEIRKKIGYMTQKFSYWGDLSLEENLEFIASMFGILNKKEKINKIINEFDLLDQKQKLARELSGGWKQRLALAASILHDPELLLLDEPTAGVDPSARREFWDKIHELASSGITILVSTHYMDEAERCHKIIYIMNGKLIAEGNLNDIIEKTNLTSFFLKIKDKNLIEIEKKIIKNKLIISTTHLGDILKISLKKENRDEIKNFLETNEELNIKNEKYSLEENAPTMEDSFIFYMKKENEVQ